MPRNSFNILTHCWRFPFSFAIQVSGNKKWNPLRRRRERKRDKDNGTFEACEMLSPDKFPTLPYVESTETLYWALVPKKYTHGITYTYQTLHVTSTTLSPTFVAFSSLSLWWCKQWMLNFYILWSWLWHTQIPHSFFIPQNQM